MSAQAESAVSEGGIPALLRNWKEAYDTCNLSPERRMDPVSRWLIITRACVFSMTFTSGVIGGLLAAGSAAPNWGFLALATFGLLLAHASNNMVNDYFDFRGGLDAGDYPRLEYSPHPIASGMISQGRLLAAILALTAVDGVIALYFSWAVGPLVLALAVAGLAISVAYVAGPFPLKYLGLGELGIFLVWGPLMIGGTYYVTAGSLPLWVLWASVPYGVMVTTVIIGKHLDKADQDRERGVRTLPVAIGVAAALRLNRVLMIGFFLAIIGLVAAGILGLWVLLVVLALPRLRQVLRVFSEPMPQERPEGYPVWPLWYVSAAFVITRRAGALFLLGLLLNLIVPLPWPA